jgi:hypothetical protein
MPGHVNGTAPPVDRAARRRQERQVAAGEVSLAGMIATAVELGMKRDACLPCLRRRRKADVAHQVMVRNAAAAAEPTPEASLPGVAQAITWIPELGPVCYEHCGE